MSFIQFNYLMGVLWFILAAIINGQFRLDKTYDYKINREHENFILFILGIGFVHFLLIFGTYFLKLLS